MEYWACSVPVAPMRREPSHRSEITSQLLFGEKTMMLEHSTEGWHKVKTKYEGYEGWIQKGQLIPIDEHKYNKPDTQLTEDWVSEIDFNGYKMYIPMGCSLTAFSTSITPWSKNAIKFKGTLINTEEADRSGKAIKQLAYKFLNTTYLWGGKSVFGIDCSGYVQTIYRFLNVFLPRDAYQQAALGETVDFLQEVRCGDLAFFDNEEGRITHVGLLLNANEIIHSSSKVRIDKIDNEGIVNVDSKERTHKLRIIKRYF